MTGPPTPAGGNPATASHPHTSHPSEVKEMTMDELNRLDPALPAPPMTVAYNPQSDAVGHGRSLPIIGGRRNYILDVLPDPAILPDRAPRVRVYADNEPGVLAKLIPDYEQIAADLVESWVSEDGAAYDDLYTEGVARRRAHAHQVRQLLQSRINDAAKRDGSWGRLTADEQAQCEGAAIGGIPTGIVVEQSILDPDGHEWTVEQAVWETPHVPLVINRWDYGQYGGMFDGDGATFTPAMQGFVPEPVSTCSFPAGDGAEVVCISDRPVNMIILDPTSDSTYLDSLEQAGLLTVTVYRPDQPDTLYLDSVRLGRALASGVFTEGGSASFADLERLIAAN